MTKELYWTTLTVLMTAVFWLPYILDRLMVRGIIPAISDTKPETHNRQSVWAQRAIRAHINAVENLVVFVAAILIAHALNISTPATQMAAMVYFFARLAHYVVYTLGIPYTRTPTFAIGWACQITILLSILGWI
jgi:uncharacterized MAPEG superfamily protein